MASYKPGLSKDQALIRQLKELQENPASTVFVSLGEAYRQHGMVQEALEICEDGLQYHPGLSSGRLLRARCFFDLKKYGSSLEELRDILEEYPQNYRALKLQTEIFLLLGQQEQAIEALRSLVLAFPQDAAAVQTLKTLENQFVPLPPRLEPGLPAFVSTDSPPSAIGDFQVTALTGFLAEEIAEEEELLAIEDKSDEPEIMESEEGLDLDPTFATKTIAELYIRQGLRKKAAAVIRKILEQNPSDPWAQSTLQGLEGDAISAFSSPTKKVVLGGREKLKDRAQFLANLLKQVQQLRRV